jgi:metal-sulfur cluster biosynthetic enzyme
MITEQAVRSALNTIVDPCSAAAGCPAGLDEMGLVREVRIASRDDGIDLLVVIGVTEYGCLMGAPFADQAYKVLTALDGIKKVEVRLDDKFDWDTGDMAAAYRNRLKTHRQRQMPEIVSFIRRG